MKRFQYILLFFISIFVIHTVSVITKSDIKNLFDSFSKKELNLMAKCYRIDGVGNNRKNPLYGAANTELLREFKNGYTDNFNALPRNELNARQISNIVVKHEDNFPNGKGASDMLWAFGQFIDHDMTFTLAQGELLPITVPSGDNLTVETIPFARTLPSSVGRKYFRQERNQINVLTAYLDLSQVYGADPDRAEYLRTLSNGLLKSYHHPAFGELLPYNFMGEEGFLDNDSHGNPALFFIAGDRRSNEVHVLTALHTLFLREHNRIAKLVKSVCISRKLDCGDPFLYRLSRILNIWQYQWIIFHEFLPMLIGSFTPDLNVLRYDCDVNPGVSNTFATAAFRVGHTLLSSSFPLIDKNDEIIERLSLVDSFFNPSIMENFGLDVLLKGLVKQKCQELDNVIVEDVRSFLFNLTEGNIQFDLAAINIQRGRDHGLPSYARIVESLFGETITQFEQITSNPIFVEKLKQAYNNDITKVDPWIGLLAEDHIGDSMAGRTLTTILSSQFRRSVEGDACFYSNIASESKKIILPIINTQLKDIIVANTEISHHELQDYVMISP